MRLVYGSKMKSHVAFCDDIDGKKNCQYSIL
jgi:hypothetical protein